MTDVSSVAVSPNGHSVYVAATGESQNGGQLAHFFVGANGSLAYDGCISSDGSNNLCLAPPNPAQFSVPTSVAVSPNGSAVYTAMGYGRVAHLFANPDQGQLSWDGCVSNDGTNGACYDIPGSGEPLGLTAFGITVSPNGSPVYALSNYPFGQHPEGTLSQMFATPPGGQLSWDGCLDNDGADGCLGVPVSGYPFTALAALAVSPNGSSVYTVSDQGIVSHLFAAPAQGHLTWDQCFSDDGSDGSCVDVPGSGTPLAGASDVAVSPDGTSVYVASDGTVSQFLALPQGQLTWARCVSNDGSGGTCAAVSAAGAPLGSGEEKLAISPDNRSLYVATLSNSAISIFDIGAQGALTFKGCVSDDAIAGCTDPPGNSLNGASAIAVSPDGASVYVTGQTNGTLVHFFRQTTGGGGGGPGGGGAAGSTTHTVTTTIGNQRVVLSSLLPTGCLAKASSITGMVSSNAITGSTASRLKFARADFYIDRGVRHVRHTTRHLNGRTIPKTTVTYTPNQTSKRQPAAASFKLTGLKTGSHTLSVRVFFHESVVRKGRRRTITVSTSRSLTFVVC